MKRIVQIDDSAEVRESTREIIELAGYEVFVAESGKQGVELTRAKIPDLVICDIMMPDLDGYGVLHILSKHPDTSVIPFIFLTAKGELDDLRKGMTLGADDYICKPFRETELIRAIEARIQRTETLKKPLFPEEQGEFTGSVSEEAGLKELKKLTENRKVRAFDRKETIFREDDHAHYLYYIIRGQVKCLKSDNYGKEFVSEVAGEGSFIGYMSFFGHNVYDETAVAMEPTEVAVIPKQDFLNLVWKNREIAVGFIKLLSGNVRDMEDRMLRLAYASLRERLAVTLLDLNGRTDNGSERDMRFRISREDLAGIVGTAKESLIRTLSELRRDGLVDTDGQDIILINTAGLKKAANGTF